MQFRALIMITHSILCVSVDQKIACYKAQSNGGHYTTTQKNKPQTSYIFKNTAHMMMQPQHEKLVNTKMMWRTICHALTANFAYLWQWKYVEHIET